MSRNPIFAWNGSLIYICHLHLSKGVALFFKLTGKGAGTTEGQDQGLPDSSYPVGTALANIEETGGTGCWRDILDWWGFPWTSGECVSTQV